MERPLGLSGRGSAQRVEGLARLGVGDLAERLRDALDLDVPSLIVLPIDYSLDVTFTEELGAETVAA